MNDNNFNHFVDPTKPVDTKLFFNLHIYTRNDKGKLSYLVFEQNGSQQYIADRVLPVDTLESAITQTLKKEFQVNDWHFVKQVEFSDDAHDNQGNPVQRVDVFVQVPWFTTTDHRVLGMTMHWLDVAEETEAEETYEDFKDLDDNDIRTLTELLSVHIDIAATAAYRVQYPEDPFTFETLIWDKFSPELENIHVGGGNHWTIWNIFPDIKEAAPELDLSLPDDGVNETENEWTMKFSALNADQHVTMEALDFWPLFNQLNSILEPFHKRFMYFDNLAEGGPSFLVVNDDFDEQAFKDIVYKTSNDNSTLEENESKDSFQGTNKSEMSKLLEDSEIKAILEEHGQLYHNYRTDDEVYSTLDDIANEWLINDLSEAQDKDLEEPDPAIRNSALNAKAVKAKIYAVELKMQQINPNYVPTVYELMKLGDWNPSVTASDEEFFKELAYYFGEQAADIYLSERSGLYSESVLREGVHKALYGAKTDAP